ncbi:MAG: MFS transporter [Paludibacteraceae bacterium]|nr:MFS transporter [Paludibacteraceae bacterium]
MRITTTAGKTSMALLIALALSHFFNDMLQAIITAVYPLLKSDMALSFAQIGAITLCYQTSASVFQPVMGMLLDKKPNPYFLPLGMTFTYSGLTILAFSDSYAVILFSVSLVGLGSSILHPEASRLTSLASGGKRGFAQSVFQVGGNTGSAVGPLLAALLIAPYGRSHVAAVACLAFVGMLVMFPICRWYSSHLKAVKKGEGRRSVKQPQPLRRRHTIQAIAILLALIFSKYLYMASLTSYYTFYLIEKFGVSIKTSQVLLFVFLGATAIGTVIGGPIGDKIGRKYVIWASILGTAPFALLMPHVSFVPTIVLSFLVGLVLSSAFPAIIIYAQELLPNHIGLTSGLFYGFAFGIAGISAAVLGTLVDSYGIGAVYQACSFIPLLGMVAYFLPNLKKTDKQH